jgi:hypothetical protein
VVTGDGGCEAYIAIMRSGTLSRERLNLAEAETVVTVEGNTLCTDMQGVTALPWSETPLRMNGRRSELGRPHLARSRSGGHGSRREAEEAKPPGKR